MRLGLATVRDLPQVAACHVLAFPTTLFAKFGEEFVAQSLRCFVEDDNKFLLFIEEDGVCAGYLSAILVTENTLGSASSMLQSGLSAGLRALARRPHLLLEPELRAKLPLVWKNVRHRLTRRRRGENHRSDAPRPAGYRSVGMPGICVHPAYRRKGYASRLMLAAEDQARGRGFHHLHCTTTPSNIAAVETYTRMGYAITERTATAVKLEKSLA